MTKTGKILVIVNLVMSMVFVAWAVGLLTNQVPWHTPPAGDGPKVEGMVAKLQDRIKSLTAARDAVEGRWADSYVDLQRVEKLRADGQRYYAMLLRSAREGNVPEIKPPVQDLVFGPDNSLKLDLNGRPAYKVDGADALAIAGYHQKIQETLAAIKKAHEESLELVAQTEKLTNQVKGVTPQNKEAPTLEEKGLRVQLFEQRDLLHGLQLEQQYLRSPLTYLTLQREQLKQRQTALLARLTEFKGHAAVLGPKD